MKKLLPSLLIIALCSACNNTNQNNTELSSSKKEVKNIIMVVADGMGPAYTTAYRYYADDPKTAVIEETVFDRHLVGSASTYPDTISGYVTDSASAATALASGIKTYNGAIGLDVNKNKVETVLHRAKKMGKKIGVVVTSHINHATPASYISHNESRENYNALADSYIDNGINTDVILGGGWKYFIREDRNLVEEYKAANFHYIDKYKGLANLPNDKPILGLFGDSGLPEAIDDSDNQRLLTMTKAAIPQLENPNGYFMLIEASQIDWAGHGNDINSAMAEVHDLVKTLEYLETYVASHPDTLVILTADHSTGGLSIAANGSYEWRPQLLTKMTESTKTIAKYFVKNEISADVLKVKLMGTEVSPKEVELITKAKSKTEEKLNLYLAMSEAEQKDKYKPNIQRAIQKQLKKLIDIKTNTGWTGSGHTAVDVPVFAFGPEKQRFAGNIDNTDIAKQIFNILEENK